MLTVNLFIIISLITSVLTFNDTIPKIPSEFLSGTKLLPERSESTTFYHTFQEYIPVACFCKQSKCNAFVKSIEPPIKGLITRDGELVTTLDVTVKEGELMYIILIDSESNVGSDTYFERTTYWNLTDNQYEILAGVPFDFETRRKVSVTTVKKDSLRFSIGLEIMRTVIASFGATMDSSISTYEESETTAHYYFSASKFSQVVGIYQLVHQLTIHPSASLLDYIGTQKTGAMCTSYFVIKRKCGFLQLLPPLLQRTSTFGEAAISLTVTGTDRVSTNARLEIGQNLLTAREKLDKKNKKDPSVKVKAAIIFLYIVSIMVIVFVAGTVYYFTCYRSRSRRRSPNRSTYTGVQNLP